MRNMGWSGDTDRKGVGWGEKKASELADTMIDQREEILQSTRVTVSNWMQGGGGRGGGGDDHNKGSNASSLNDNNDGAEEEEAAVNIIKQRRRLFNRVDVELLGRRRHDDGYAAATTCTLFSSSPGIAAPAGQQNGRRDEYGGIHRLPLQPKLASSLAPQPAVAPWQMPWTLLLGGRVAPTLTMTTTINVNDTHLLILLGQRRLGMAIVSGIKSPWVVITAPLPLGFGRVAKRGGGLQQWQQQQ
jgi:hypothetical protein